MALLISSYVLWVGVLVIGVPPRRVRPEGIDLGPVAGGLLDISTLMLVVAIMASTVCLVLRLRRSVGVQRQQLRWIMASCALLGLGLVVLLAYQAAAGGPGEPWYVDLPLFLGYTSLPVFAGIAVLRYRLYDIDVIISRAVVFAALTVFVTIGYVAVVVAIGLLLGSRVVGRFWPSLLALVLVALAFQPIRQRLLRWADRLVYGRRAAPYEALASFSRRLGRSPRPADLLPALAEAVAGGVGAAQVRVTLDVPGTAGLSAAWPASADGVPDVALDVRDRGESLGRIALSMPPGRGLRPAERRLLDDFVAQAGVAFRNLRLDADLRASVERLGRQSAELAASRRRLLAARDDERRRIAGVIEREVLSHLRPIPAAVESMEVADSAAAGQRFDRLEAATATALDALREVTRGLFPVLLSRYGLVPALRAHVGRLGRPDALTVAPELEGDGSGSQPGVRRAEPESSRRFEPRIEAAAYFCAVALLARPPAASRMDLAVENGSLVLEATIAVPDHVDLDRLAIVDRVEAAGGHLSIGRSTVRVEFPPAGHLDADAQSAASRSVPNADLTT
jgi:signal transduction histidine kinase